MKKNKFFVADISTVLYTFEKGREEKFFFTLLKMFYCPPFSKMYKKVVEFSFTPTKNIMVFSFSFQFSVYPMNSTNLTKTIFCFRKLSSFSF